MDEETTEAIKELVQIGREMLESLDRIDGKLDDLKLEAELSRGALETIDSSARTLREIATIVRKYDK